MGMYKSDPNNSKKQIPNIQGKNRRDSARNREMFTFGKTPHYVVINKADSSNNIGFFFGNSASFASSVVTHLGVSTDSTVLSASSAYTPFGKPASGTVLNIHPTAWSGSSGDSVTFVYKSGLSTGGF